MSTNLEKDIHECIASDPFQLIEDYHYYNPDVYSMGAYFNGHNLRQMKRYSYIIWRLQYAYHNLYKHSLVFGATPMKDEMLGLVREMYVNSQQVIEELFEFPTTSKYSKLACHGNFESWYDNHQSARRFSTVEVCDEYCRNSKYFIYTDKWETKKREIKTKKDFSKHFGLMQSFYANMEVFILWGHWLKYLFEADLESGKQTGLDLKNLNQLIERGVSIIPKLEEFKSKQHVHKA